METDAWVEELTTGDLRIEPETDGGFRAVGRRAATSIDLATVPDGVRLTVTTRTNQGGEPAIEVDNARTGHHLRVEQPSRLVVSSGELGRLDYEGPDSGRVPAHLVGRVRQLEVHSGTVRVTEEGHVVTAHLHDGSVTDGRERVDTFEIRGAANLFGEYTNLRVGDDTTVRTTNQNTSIELVEFVGHNETAPRLTVTSDSNNPRVIEFKRLKGPAKLTLEQGSIVQAHSAAAGLDIDGQGTLKVPVGLTLSDVNASGRVAIDAGAGAALLRFSGELLVADVQNASVVAATPGGFRFTGFGPTRTGRRGPEQFEGATLRGIAIPDNAEGRRQLQQMQQAAIVEPHIRQLRFFHLKWRVPFIRRWRVRSDAETRELSDAAFFAEELAGFVQRKCGSGSTRTDASWAAYRARQLNASSAVERVALGVYRLVGYSQRPAPPALSWVALSAVVSFASFSTGWPNPPALAGFDDPTVLELAIALLLSPLLLLRLVGDPQVGNITGLPDLLPFVLKSAIAAPFVFTVVATTRYLRAQWPWR